MTASEQVMQAFAVLLTAIPGAAFFRSRKSALAREEGDAILLEREEERVEKRTQIPALTLRRLTVLVTVLTRADVPDQAADPHVENLTRSLLADPTLGGRCAQIVEIGTRWSFDEADLTAGATEIRFDVLYQTLASNLVTTQ